MAPTPTSPTFRGSVPDWDAAPPHTERWQSVHNSWVVNDESGTTQVYLWRPGSPDSWIPVQAQLANLRRNCTRVPLSTPPTPPTPPTPDRFQDAPAHTRRWSSACNLWVADDADQVWVCTTTRGDAPWRPSTATPADLENAAESGGAQRLPVPSPSPSPDVTKAPAGAEIWRTSPRDCWALVPGDALALRWSRTRESWVPSRTLSLWVRDVGTRLSAPPLRKGDKVQVLLTGTISRGTAAGEDGVWLTEAATGRGMYLGSDMDLRVTVTEPAPTPDPHLEPGDLVEDATGALYIYNPGDTERPYLRVRSAEGYPNTRRWSREYLTGPLTAVTTRPKAQQ